MAIALDSGIAGDNQLSSSTLTWNHTVAASNEILVVKVNQGNLPGRTITGINWDNAGTPAALTQLISQGTQASSPFVFTEIWYLKNPSTGTKQIRVTFSGTTTASACSESWSGVDQTTPFGTASGAIISAGSQPTITISSAVGEIVLGAVVVNINTSTTLAPGSGVTEVYNLTQGSSIAGAGAYKTGASSVTVNWTGSDGDNGIVAVSMKPVAAETITVDKWSMPFSQPTISKNPPLNSGISAMNSMPIPNVPVGQQFWIGSA